MKWVFLTFGLTCAWAVAGAARAVFLSGRSAIGLNRAESCAGVTSANCVRAANAAPSTHTVGEPLAAPIRQRESLGYSPAGFCFSVNRNRRRHDWLPLLFRSGQIRRVA